MFEKVFGKFFFIDLFFYVFSCFLNSCYCFEMLIKLIFVVDGRMDVFGICRIFNILKSEFFVSFILIFYSEVV